MSLPYQVLQVRKNSSEAPRAPPSKEEMQGPESLGSRVRGLGFRVGSMDRYGMGRRTWQSYCSRVPELFCCVCGWGGSFLRELNRWYIISLRVGSGSFWLGFRSFELLRVQDSDVKVTIFPTAASANCGVCRMVDGT